MKNLVCHARRRNSVIGLRGIAWDHTRGFDPMVATAVAFMREHPGVEIFWEKRSLHDFGHAPVDRLAREYDLVVLDHPWVGFVAETNCCLPLDELLTEDLLNELATHSAGPSHKSYEWEGRQWALAIDAATPSASYRPDLLDAMGASVPATWDEALELGARARVAGKYIAIPLCPVDAMTAFLSLADNLDGKPFATTGQIVAEEIGVRVLEALSRILAYCPGDVFDLSPIRVMDRMSATDELVYCPHAYSYNNYARPGFRPHLCRYANMAALGEEGPRGSHIGGTGLAVSSRCQHARIAAEYAGRVASGPWQKTVYFQAGGQPAHTAAWEDDAVNAASTNFFRDTRDTIDRAFLRPRYNGYIPLQYEGGAIITAGLRAGGNHRAMLNELNALYRHSMRWPV
jgi:multiple sugar transport system substrate-binding protein